MDISGFGSFLGFVKYAFGTETVKSHILTSFTIHMLHTYLQYPHFHTLPSHLGIPETVYHLYHYTSLHSAEDNLNELILFGWQDITTICKDELRKLRKKDPTSTGTVLWPNRLATHLQLLCTLVPEVFFRRKENIKQQTKKRREKTSGYPRCESHYHATIHVVVNQHHEID